MKYQFKVAAAVLLAFTTMTSPLVAHIQASAQTVKQGKSITYKTGNLFLDTIAQQAVKISNEYGIYASVLLAQAALESNFGQSGLAQAPNFNLFGIKGQYNGNSASFSTLEQNKNGEAYRTMANFRKYASYEESLLDYARLLTTSSYYTGTLKANTMSYKDALIALEGRYATDQQYAAKLQRIIDTYDLTKYDDSMSEVTIIENEDGTTTTNVKASKVIAVVKGDTLSAIAKTYGVTVDDLMSWNGLKSTALAIGDELIVAIETESPTTVEKATKTEVQKEVQKVEVVEQKPTYTPTRYYKVKKGDSLSTIASKYNISKDDLKTWNELKSASLKKNQKLIVAVKEQKVEKKKEAKIHARYYTVQNGDSLASIARAFTTTEAKLKQINKLSSNLLYTGQKIKVQ